MLEPPGWYYYLQEKKSNGSDRELLNLDSTSSGRGVELQPMIYDGISTGICNLCNSYNSDMHYVTVRTTSIFYLVKQYFAASCLRV